MRKLTNGLIYLTDFNKIIYSNEYIVNSGLDLSTISDKLGEYAEYISEDNKDILYAKTKGVKVFDEETVNEFNYSLIETVDLDKEITNLKLKFADYCEIIDNEYQYILKSSHNILLLKIAFLLKKHLDNFNINVYLMRGSGISSFILYAIGLNKVNPLKFNLNYKNFWK